MNKKRMMSGLSLVSVFFCLNACTQMKFSDTENGIKYTKDSGEDGFRIAEYLSELPTNLTIKGTIEDLHVLGFVVNFENKGFSSKVKHLSFESSKGFKGDFTYYTSLLDMTFPDSGSYAVTASSDNLRSVTMNGANVNCTLSSSRSMEVRIEGGTLSNHNAFDKLFIKKESVVESGILTDNNDKNPLDYINNTAVFSDGYNFSDEFYCRTTYHYQKKKFWSGTVSEEEKLYLPFAYVIYLPKTVTYISDRFFGNTPGKKNIEIHYEGTEEEWKKVRIFTDNNDNYQSATLIYQSVYTEE